MNEIERQKALEEKIKRFDRALIGYVLNIFVSMITAIAIHILLLH